MARPRAVQLEPTIQRVRVHHKPSGTIYVEDRTCLYDYEKQRYRTLKSKRVGKIDPATGAIVPCRPKRTKKRCNPNQVRLLHTHSQMNNWIKRATDDLVKDYQLTVLTWMTSLIHTAFYEVNCNLR